MKRKTVKYKIISECKKGIFEVVLNNGAIDKVEIPISKIYFTYLETYVKDIEKIQWIKDDIIEDGYNTKSGATISPNAIQSVNCVGFVDYTDVKEVEKKYWFFKPTLRLGIGVSVMEVE